MPNRTVSQLRVIALDVRKRIWAMPCTVCQVPYFIKCDHIVPVAHGGDGRASNIQPLCHSCNHIKGCRLSNMEVAAVVKTRGLRHFLTAAYRHGIRYQNSFDAPSLEQWLGTQPELEVQAAMLYIRFLETTS